MVRNTEVMDESVGDLLPEPIRPGRRLGSNYVVGNRLGRGAMGVVHEATTHDGRQLAVKFLRAELAADHKTVARFLQERHIFRTVDHPNVVRVHDLVAEGDDLAIVMERVNGGDLKRRIEARSLSPRQSMAIAREIAAGLAAIHGASVVHRDLKPANILLTEDLSPKISDFGISRLVTEAMTRTSATIGTPIYMAPEAADARGADAPADVYALGIIMFELLTGRAPFTEGGTFAVLRAHAMDRPPRVEGVPGALADLIDQMLAKQPTDRPTIDVVHRRLTELVAQIDDTVRPVAVSAPATEPQGLDSVEVTGSPAGAAGLAAAGAAGAAVGGGAFDAAGAGWAATSGGTGGGSSDSMETAVHDPAASGDPAVRSGDPVAWSGDPVPGGAIPHHDPTVVHPGLAGAGSAGQVGPDPSSSSETIVNPALAGAAGAVAAGAAGAVGRAAPVEQGHGFVGLQHGVGDPASSGGPPFGPGPSQAQERRGRAPLLPNRIPRRVAEVGIALASLAAVLVVAAVILTSGGDGGSAAIGSGGVSSTTDPAGIGTNPVGGPGDDDEGPITFGDDGDADQDGATSTTTTGTTGGSSTTGVGSSTTTGSSSTIATTTSTVTSTTEQATTTTRQTTTTRPTTTISTTTTSTTTTEPPATPIRIVSGPTLNTVNATSFQFNYTTNNVCGTGSFTVTEVATGVSAGSFNGANVCFGPLHGGFPGFQGSADFRNFDIKPGTEYRVSITVRGTQAGAGDSLANGSGSDSTSFRVTTAAA
jgi:serine/threonine-protein kinase